MIFEIHITGEESILKEFNDLGIKNITIELLTPDRQVLRTEYMCSLVKHFDSYEQCKDFVDDLEVSLKSRIIRVKIECPYYPEYVERSVYIESHFSKHLGKHALSRNKMSGKIIGTSRMYEKEQYNWFRMLFKEDAEVELCLYDDYIREDFDWFKLYE